MSYRSSSFSFDCDVMYNDDGSLLSFYFSISLFLVRCGVYRDDPFGEEPRDLCCKDDYASLGGMSLPPLLFKLISLFPTCILPSNLLGRP